MIHQPFHQRFQLAHLKRVSEYNQAVNSTAKVARWYPLKMLLSQKFKGSDGVRVSFDDLEVGRLIALRDEYEQGMGRKG